MLVKDILYRQKHIISPLYAVDIIRDRNEPDTHIRKNPFEIPARIDIIPSESRKILHNDAVYISLIYIIHHPSECGTVEVCARISVVNIRIIEHYVFTPVYVVHEEFSLIYDAVTFLLVTVLPR